MLRSAAILLILSVVCFGQLGGSNLEPSTVYRDSQSAPHIFANTERAAFYGYGRIQMQDLPTSVAYNFALAAGELSSLLGEGVPLADGRNLHIKLDTEARLYRIRQRALIQKAQLPTDIKQMLQAYVMGVNESRMEWLLNINQLVFNTEPYSYDLPTLTRMLSRPITLDDVLMLGIYFSGQAGIQSNDGLAYSDDPSAAENLIRTASNSFAIAPDASSNGNAMLLADPHLPFDKFSILRTYFCQISGASYDMCGFSIPGFPCIGVGFNANFGWAITSNNPDEADTWHAVANVTGTSFLVDGKATPIFRQPDLIDVWDYPSNSLKPYPIVLAYAGDLEKPIIREKVTPATTIAGGRRDIWFGSVALGNHQSSWEFLIRLGQCQDIVQARTVFNMGVASGNYLMADSTGDLAYVYTGRVPIRKRATPGTDYTQVQDGNTRAHYWRGIHPTKDLPFEHLKSSQNNGEREKWLQCNSAADLVRPDTTIDLNKFPEYMVHQKTTPESWRQRRGRQLLDSYELLSSQDLRDASTDILAIWYDAVADHLDLVAQEFGLRKFAEVDTMMTALAAWDRMARVTDTEPVYAHMIYAYFSELQRHTKSKTTSGHYEVFDFPAELPDLDEFSGPDWYDARSNMAAAMIKAATTYGRLLNPLLPNVTFPLSPWTPAPWAGYSTSVPEWGTAHYLGLTPTTAIQDAALYPADGLNSMFTLGTEIYPNPEDTIIENAGILGQYGPLVSIPLNAGAHTLFQVTFGTNFEAWYLEALGPSEIANDPKRYANAAFFASRTWQPFVCDHGLVSATAVDILNFDLNVANLAP